MKKSLLFFTLLSFAFMGVYAQTPYWNTTGNALTNSTQFIGTTDFNPLIFKTNTLERMRLLSDKPFLGIGTSNPEATLHLYYQDSGFPQISQNLLKLTTPTCTTGFSIISNMTTKAIYFKQQEEAKFFIEGVGGGFVVAPTGKIGFGTDDPQEKIHLQGKMVIDRTENTKSSLQFKHPDSTRDIDPGTGGPQEFIAPHYWDIFSDRNGVKFNKVLKSDGTSAQMMVITQKGRIGIGVANPLASLHVGQHILADGNITTKEKLILATDNTTNRWEISRTNTGLNYAYNTTSLKDILFISNDGKIGIGKTNPATALDVNGIATVTELNAHRATVNTSFTTGSATINNDLSAKNATINNALSAQSATIAGKITANDMRIDNLLCAKEIKVQRTSCWPDYVFSKSYNLMPLNEVEQFIAEKQHLPNVPSAAEVEVNGIELGEMNATLLKKVEELTLYIIDLQKQIDKLKKQ